MMKKFLTIASIIIVAFVYLISRMSGKATNAQALSVAPVVPTSSQVPTDTPYPTVTPLPTIDYAATDNAFQLEMQRLRNENIAAQNAHDEVMMAQQVELARANAAVLSIGATQTYAPTAVALTNANITAEANRLAATVQAPVNEAALLNAQVMQSTVKENRIKFNIFFTLSMILIVVIIALLVKKLFTLRAVDIMKAEQEQREQDPEIKPAMIDYTIRDDKKPSQTRHGVLPCTPKQMDELAEMVVNGRRTFGYNDMESNSETLRDREVMRGIRTELERAGLAVNNRKGETILNDYGIAFFEEWFENHQLAGGWSFAEDPPSPTAENV